MMSRPQIGIDRLPIRRSGNESKEAMNCKSCRKRKIKCNRVKPSCEACQVFNCACIYDATPKKRGPKTDVLEALLKRVNGLEKRLKDDEKPTSSDQVETSHSDEGTQEPKQTNRPLRATDRSKMPEKPREERRQTLLSSDSNVQAREIIAFTDALLDTYFARVHNNPYYVLDETNTRQRLRDGQLPRFLVNAIHAVAIRYVPHLCGGYSGAVRSSQQYVMESRNEIDVDEPTIDHLQALLLLAMANFQAGKGKKSYMLLSHAISMAYALGLHREIPAGIRCTATEREGRRKLFWTCYLMDRFTTSGSRRPPLISDVSINLRLPAWNPSGSQRSIDGNYFLSGASLPYASGVSNAGQGSGAMLVEIVRILGVTNRYLAAGGVKGDSHFPWHAQSTLSRIRSDLDYWAANTQDSFSSLDALFGQIDSMVLVLSKLIYHLVHCLLYRPFLPVDLNELSGSSQHQSWQVEATNLCFMHANAIAELVEIGKTTGIIYWPSFVGFCVFTAGTVHVHGAHYILSQDGQVFRSSADFLSREMVQLSDLRFIWAGVQHQRNTLQILYHSHSQLVQSLACSPVRLSPVFQMEDFFDRYPGSGIDGAHITFADVAVEGSHESHTTYDLPSRDSMWMSLPQLDLSGFYQPVVPSQYAIQARMHPAQRSYKRRRTTDGVAFPYLTPTSDPQSNPFDRRQSSESEHPNFKQQLLQQSTEHRHIASNCEEAHDKSLDHIANPTLAASPSFTFSPMPQTAASDNTGSNHENSFNHMQIGDDRTPSASVMPAQAETDGDPFLSFLEQLAENDGTGAPSELDMFLNRQDTNLPDIP